MQSCFRLRAHVWDSATVRLLWRKMPRVMLPLVSVHLPRVSHMVDLLWKLAKTNVEENMVFFSVAVS